MLIELAQIYHGMDRQKQNQVTRRLMLSGALPISRDTPSYAAMMSIVEGNKSCYVEILSNYVLNRRCWWSVRVCVCWWL